MLNIELNGPGEVRMAGRLDAVEAPRAQEVLDKAAGVVTLDCAGLEYISSAGLGVLLKTHKRLLASSGRMRLASVRPHIRDIFRYS
ncbi:MAG: STAS domain-containing protein, partial [Pseudomonadota bacterium]